MWFKSVAQADTDAGDDAVGFKPFEPQMVPRLECLLSGMTGIKALH